jgi:1-acyl-sn-glycerol-3-phosphate acyltransferase
MRVGSTARRAAALGFCFDQMVRGGLRGVWLRGEVPPGGALWVANHHSWWDGFVANAVLRHLGHRPALVMDAENLRRFAFLRDAGALPADQPRTALTALRQGRTVIVFPEGRLRPPGPLGRLAPGAAWLARLSGKPVVVAATRTVLRGDQKPEAYVDLSPCADDQIADRLAGRLQELDADLAGSDPRQPLGGYELVVRGRSSWDERIARVSTVVHR